MFKRLMDHFTNESQAEHRAELYRKLVRKEARIGGELFGPIPAGGSREFFCLDEHTWVWHEERPDEKNRLVRRTTRYDIRAEGIFKAQKGQSYKAVTIAEAQRLYDAAQIYSHRIAREVYNYVI